MASSSNANSAYEYVAWEINTTGKKFIDEMCQLAAYVPKTAYAQYIIPFRDIDYSFRQRYLLRTVNIGYYRALKETVGGKILKTKSEVSALNDFLTWLENRKSTHKKNIILMYYKTFTPTPFILLESLRKYDLLERFKKSVAGFVDSSNFIKGKCEKSFQKFSIKTLAKILLDEENQQFHDACKRAQILYEIVAHLTIGECSDSLEDLNVALSSYIMSVGEIEDEICNFKLTLAKQKSLKPIFGPLIRIDKKRRQALILRRYLTEANIDYESLKTAATTKEELKKYLQQKLSVETEEKGVNDLVNIVHKHFDSNTSKSNIKPKFNSSRSYYKRNVRNRNRITGNFDVKKTAIDEQVSNVVDQLGSLEVSCNLTGVTERSSSKSPVQITSGEDSNIGVTNNDEMECSSSAERVENDL